MLDANLSNRVPHFNYANFFPFGRIVCREVVSFEILTTEMQAYGIESAFFFIDTVMDPVELDRQFRYREELLPVFWSAWPLFSTIVNVSYDRKLPHINF